jgi:multimeric flavodoxin WrbA
MVSNSELHTTAADIRTGMPPRKLSHDAFVARFLAQYRDPVFDHLRGELRAVAEAAWDAYADSRKAPMTRKAGAGFRDPDYEIAVDWLDARAAIQSAQQRYEDRAGPVRLLLINGSARTEHTCPGEMSKTWRLVEMARETLQDAAQDLAQGLAQDLANVAIDVLDLSRTTSEYGLTIHPCKSCVSTAMPLCHWPCSCYPNHALGQVHDWMNDIYPLWVAAHGIMIITPVNWYQAPSPLKSMMDRLVCADGGNPDPTSTHGKHADEAKALELAGWPYPRHLAGRLISIIVHGDSVGAESLRRNMVDWATDMHLVPAGTNALVDAYVGYYEPYAVGHHALDKDVAFQAEVRNAARTLLQAAQAQRSGRLVEPGSDFKDPRPK